MSHDAACDAPLAGGLLAPPAPRAVTRARLAGPACDTCPRVADLTRALQRGDEAAFRSFQEHYLPRLLRYLLVLARGNEIAARDALQQTFLRVARHARPFDAEEKFWSWLTVVARTALVDERRKQNRYLAVLARFLQRQAPYSPSADADADERLLQLLEVSLDLLPDPERDLIRRKYFSGRTVRELAEETQTTGKALESRLVRIRHKLKEAILARLDHETLDSP